MRCTYGVTYYTSQSRKSIVIASAETLYYGHYGTRRVYAVVSRWIFTSAHTRSVSVNSPAARITAYAVCVIHRGRKQMFSQPVFGSPTRRLLYANAIAYIIILCRLPLRSPSLPLACIAFLAIKVGRQLYENRYASAAGTYHTCGITTTLCPSCNNILLIYCTVLSF